VRRFFHPDLNATEGESFALREETRHHLTRVLRLRSGAQFELFDEQGRRLYCELKADERQVEVLAERKAEKSRLQMELIQALPKGEKLELILQKGTELGVSKFVLSASERAVTRIHSDKEKTRIVRWQKIIQHACQQCGQMFPPALELCSRLEEALLSADGVLKLMLWEEADTPLDQVLPAAPPAVISVLIGPEGGFSAAEAQAAQGAGFLPVRLGPRILRTETAGLAILSILQYVYGDFCSVPGDFAAKLHGEDPS
jgi:16S rRNA (uracil1498-N3)-methyltransferase